MRELSHRLCSRVALWVLAIAAPFGCIHTAAAQDSPRLDPSTTPASETTTQTDVRQLGAPAAAGTALAAEVSPYKRFDELMEPGLTTEFPGPVDSVFGDAGGVRTWLADRDIGIEGRLATIGVYNPLDTGQPDTPQRYNGQVPTLQTHSLTFVANFGLAKVGLPNSRIILGTNYIVTTYAANGPNTVSIRNVAYYQSFNNRKIELKVGIMPNYYEYAGFFTGGSPVLATGVAGLLPVQAGLSADPVHTPAANLTFHFQKGTYLKLGVQRSVSPLGNPEEIRRNRSGLRFGVPGAGALVIGEVGVQRSATAGSKQIWLRAGGFYNASDYTRFDGRGTQANQSAYVAGDLQLTQPDPGRPAHGVYIGGSAFWNNPKVNVFTQSYEARAYKIGVLKARPTDTVALRATYLKYSPDGRDANLARGVFANKYQLSATGSYSAHFGKGIYFTPAVSYIHGPSFIGDFKDALSLSATLFLLI